MPGNTSVLGISGMLLNFLCGEAAEPWENGEVGEMNSSIFLSKASSHLPTLYPVSPNKNLSEIHILKRCVFHLYHSSMPLSMTYLCLKGGLPNFHHLCEFLVTFNIHLRKPLLSEPQMPPLLPRDLVTFFSPLFCTPIQGTNIRIYFGIRNLS